jgi:hypothetical protein
MFQKNSQFQGEKIMRKAFYLFTLALLVSLSSFTQANETVKDQNAKYQDNRFKNGKKPANLWHEIPFFPGGDIGQYTTTMSQTRDDVRKMFWQELMGEVQQLADKGAAVEAMIEPMANILMKFDQMHDIHKAKDIVNIDYSLEAQFKAALDSAFAKYDIRDNQRRLQISKGTDADLLESYIRGISIDRPFGKTITKDELEVKKALEMFNQIDYVSYGTFSSLGKGNFQLTFHIIGYKNGVTRNFITRGPLVQALDQLAFQVFDFFQSNVYEEWKAPYANLIWLPMPINPERQRRIEESNSYDLYSFNEAKSYCQARGYRLPYAKELLMAETGTKYNEGGITSLYPYALWVVADRRQVNENNWINPSIAESTNGIFMADAITNHKGVFWCVRGTVSKDVALMDKIWSLIRKYRNKNLEVYTALQTLRFEIGDYNAQSEEIILWAGDFVTVKVLDSVDEALEVLSQNGINLDWQM